MLVLSVLLSGAGNYQREIRYECSDIALSHRLSPRAATRFRSKAGTSTQGWLLQKSPPDLGITGSEVGKDIQDHCV